MTEENNTAPSPQSPADETPETKKVPDWEKEEILLELGANTTEPDTTAAEEPVREPQASEPSDADVAAAWMEADAQRVAEQEKREAESQFASAFRPADDTTDIPLPPEENNRGDGKRHRTGRERKLEKKEVIKTPAYYEGPGRDEPFKVNFDFQRAYCDPVQDRPFRHANIRHTGWLGGILYFLFVLCVSTTAACLAWLAATDVLALGKTDGIVDVTVPDDFTVEDVSKELFSKGIIKYEKLFTLYGRFSHADEKIDPGTYQIHTNFDYRALVHGMTEDDGEMIEVDVTVPEGYSMDEIAALLEESGVCTKEKFFECAADTVFEYDFLSAETGDPYRLEGYLFPDTYKFYMNDDPERVIDKFLTDFDQRFTDEMLGRAEATGWNMREILTVASIIEEEAGNDSERANIAAVIYNRLSYGMQLQMDSTVNYALARTGQETFDTNVQSPYNTYLCEGLPAGPITNPGLASIEAALYPSETGYLYFGVDVDGDTIFFEDFDGFTEFVNSDRFGG